MTEKGYVATASENENQTAAQIMEQIKEKERELKAKATTTPPSAPEPTPDPEPAAPASAPEIVPSNKPAEPAPESNAGGVPGPEGKDKPDWKKWIEKKGFKSTEDMVRSMRELERELTLRSRSQPVSLQDQQIPMPQPPSPPQPVAPMVSREEMAKRYNIDPDDFEKVVAIAGDIASSQIARQTAHLSTELRSLRRDVSRSSELQTLKEDPAFADPRVQFEMHQILQTNPSILQNEPAPYRFAFNEALRSMGRRILEGSVEPYAPAPSGSGSPVLPNTPPVTAGGSGSGSAAGAGGIKPTGRMTADAMARLPAAEQRKILSQIGAIREEEA